MLMSRISSGSSASKCSKVVSTSPLAPSRSFDFFLLDGWA
jgi:hypothetical protein